MPRYTVLLFAMAAVLFGAASNTDGTVKYFTNCFLILSSSKELKASYKITAFRKNFDPRSDGLKTRMPLHVPYSQCIRLPKILGQGLTLGLLMVSPADALGTITASSTDGSGSDPDTRAL